MDIYKTLGPKLSSEATLWLMGEPGFVHSSARWNDWETPSFVASIDVANESDVIETVKWAHENKVRFLAQSATHGWPSSLHNIRNAVSINIKPLKKLQLNTHNNTAVIGGGLTLQEITSGLYKYGKQIPTGSCPGVGFFGALLGGGVGRLQGLYGLSLDQLLEARVITADGSMITASRQRNPDLFWALKGAGHNFGIVAEAIVQVHDVLNDGVFYVADMTFDKEKVSQVVALLDELQPLPPQACIYTFFATDPQGSGKFTVNVDYTYAGPEHEGKYISEKFQAIGAMCQTISNITYDKLLNGAAFALGPMMGIPGGCKSMWSIGVTHLDVSTLVELVNELDQFRKDYPAFSGSTLTIESYSLQGLKAVPDESTAYPHRDIVHHLLWSYYFPDMAFSDQANAFGKKLRRMAQEKSGFSEMKTYVNYAHGDESQEAIYGEQWCREKLAALKNKYDPRGEFDGYNPIKKDVR